ncbi:MAG: WG repeat-containing protein [Oscillospiraceae bacterium]|nr:WG repeat-containing protein [Oscillospiraceae bacterium]
MKKRILSLAITLALIFTLIPYYPATTAAVYYDIQVLQQEYGHINGFYQGVATFRRDDKFGVINKTGKEVVPPIYDLALTNDVFHLHERDDVILVELDGKRGLIDFTGKEVLSPVYYTKGEGYVIGGIYATGVFYKAEDFDSDKEYSMPIYDFIDVSIEGMAAVRVGGTADQWGRVLGGKWGFIDKTGKEIIPLIYDEVSYFSDGLARVRIIGEGTGFIDRTGKLVIPLIYSHASVFSGDMAIVSDNSGTFYIDKDGNKLASVDSKYTVDYWNDNNYSEGIALTHDNGKYGFIDSMGKDVIPPTYDAIFPFADGLAKVRFGGKHGFIDKTGKEIVPPKYDFVGDFSNGIATIRLDGKWGCIDNTGKEIVPPTHVFTVLFSEGFAQVNIGGKYGFIDLTGKEIIPPVYDLAWQFSEGLAAVRKGEKWGYIDPTGKEVIPIAFEHATSFSDGVAAVKLDGKWAILTLSDAPTEATAPNLDSADTWAHIHITEAIDKGFLPVSLQGIYKNAITRSEFVTLAMSWLRYHTGLTVAQLVEKYAVAPDRTFTDTTDPVIIAAAQLDITAGIGGGQFGVNTQFNREQAAMMLMKVHIILNKAGGNFNTINPPDFGFADILHAGEGIRIAVNFVGNYEVMSGSGSNFNPKETFSRQHSITVFNNIDRRESR